LDRIRGFLDGTGTGAFITLDFGQGALDFLIDTGFDGSLVVGEELFDRSNAVSAGAITAELASDQTFQYETFLVEFEWLGQTLLTRVLVGTGKECLLGTALLEPHRLEIDYRRRTVELIPDENW
jgi:clan AA aspartic protease